METTVLSGKNIAANEWDAFVLEAPQGNIYHCHAYLSNLMPNWLAVVVRDGDQIVAAMPFEPNRKWGIAYALQPYFAQYLGILLIQKSGNVYKNLEFQKKAIQLIHEAIPKEVRYLDFNFAPEFNYELPLIWLGWRQKMRYTYWVDISRGFEAFLQSCASHVRREVKKSEQAGLVVKVENNPEMVIEILKTAKPDAMRNIPPHYFEALCKNARHFFEVGKSRCFIGYDHERPIAGIIYFFFGSKMIYYQGSTLPAYKNSGIMSNIIAESVRLYAQDYQHLDFDGSMIEPIERFFRGFGAAPVRYSNFILNRLPLLPRLAHQLKSLRGAS